jgi:hypothetical protein
VKTLRMRLSSQLEVLRVPDFRWVFSAAVASTPGDSGVPVAVAFAVLDTTGSATDLGLLPPRRSPVASLLFGGRC